MCPKNKILSKGVCIDKKKCQDIELVNGEYICFLGNKKKDNKRCIGGIFYNGVCKCPLSRRLQNRICKWINPNPIKNCPHGTRRAGISCIPIVKPSTIKDAKKNFVSKKLSINK